MKIIKPLTLGTLHKPYTLDGRHYLSVGALGFFKLGASQPRFLLETEQWPKVLKELPVGQPLDMAMPKGCAEFLLAGKAYSASGKPVASMEVAAALGGLAKVIRVSGDRHWYYGPMSWFKITKPEPFTSMPLGYERAFGGEKYLYNTDGKGHNPNRLAWAFGANQGQMPNLEYPHQPVKKHSGKYPPASFGPVDLRWKPRRNRAGTYNQKWLSNDFPGLAEDVQMTLFNAAAEDQWQKGYWQGGEAYRLQGMHPHKELIEGRLPSFSVHALARQKIAGSAIVGGVAEGHATEVSDGGAHEDLHMSLQADTVWFFPHLEVGLMIYRGQTEINDSDALNISALLLGYDSVAESVKQSNAKSEQGSKAASAKSSPIRAPRNEQYYADTLDLRLDRKTAAGQVLNEAALIPPMTEFERKQQAAKRKTEKQTQKQRTEAFIQELGVTPSDADSDVEASESNAFSVPEELQVSLSLDDIAAGGIDLGAALIELDEKVAALRQLQEAEMQRSETLLQELSKELPGAADLLSEIELSAGQIADQWQQALAKAMHLPIDLHPQMGQLSDDFQQLMVSLEKDLPEQGSIINGVELPSARDQVAQLEAQSRAAKRMQPEQEDERTPLAKENATRLGELVAQLLADGAPLAGRDFTDAALSGMDFRGLDLREVNFEGADLGNCRFAGSNLTGSCLLGANLQNADFAAAELSNANLCRVVAVDADFSGSNCSEAMMLRADFSRARLVGTNLSQALANNANFSGADLSGSTLRQTLMNEVVAPDSRWVGAELSQAVLASAELYRADFSQSRGERLICASAKARDSIWRGSQMVRSYFGSQSDFDGTDWRDADIKTCGFRDSTMQRADWRAASFFQCDFSRATLDDTIMEQAILCRSVFIQSSLKRANIVRADLHQAVCRKADFTDADLSESNLVHADMQGVTLINTRLNDVLEQAA